MKILISGYYGFGNAGDELILETIVSELSAKLEGVALTVLSVNPRETSETHKLRAVNRWNLFKVIREIAACDILISGGGGLFQDSTGSIGLYYYLLIIFLAKLAGKKIYIYGAGVNNLKYLNRIITAKIFKLADGITVRERESFNLLVNWGLPKDKIVVTADPVMLKEVKAGRHVQDKPTVVFILRPPVKSRWSVELFSKLADALAQRLKADIVFMPFHPQNDREYSLCIMHMMKAKASLVEWKKFDDIYETVGKADLVISQRLHGLILALLYGIPLIGISEDTKIDRFLKELGQKNISLMTEENYYSVLAVILDMWEWRDEFKKTAKKILPHFRLRAKKNSEMPFLY